MDNKKKNGKKPRSEKISKSDDMIFNLILDEQIPIIKHIINMKNSDQEICIMCKNMRNVKCDGIVSDKCSININPETNELLNVSNICRCGLFEKRKIIEYDDHWDVEFNGSIRNINKNDI